jgi:hypothetical protein
MRSAIWKYPLTPAGNLFEVPEGARRVVHVGLDPQDSPSIWLLIEDVDAPKTAIRFIVVPTGAAIDATGYVPLGSFSPKPGLMFHVLAPLGQHSNAS